LDYSVQAVKAGHVELGVVRLPYYDEEKRRYRVAKVDLGAIDVEAKPASKNSAQPSSPPEISEVPIELSPRRKLEAIPQEPRRVPPWAWMIVLLSPLGALVVRAIGAGVSSLSVRREKRAKRDARHHLDLAQAEIAQGNSQAALSSLERALFAGVFEATSVRARGILRESLSGELQNAGLPKSLCERVTRQLGDLEAARYGQGTRDTAELAATANELVAELHKFRSVRRKS
jgi:hypothetical protein